jgi:hypothetical protein
MNCFLKKLFGKKCDDKKPDNLETKPESEEVKDSGSDQLSPDSEFKHEGEGHHQDSHESTNEEFKQ